MIEIVKTGLDGAAGHQIGHHRTFGGIKCTPLLIGPQQLDRRHPGDFSTGLVPVRHFMVRVDDEGWHRVAVDDLPERQLHVALHGQRPLALGQVGQRRDDSWQALEIGHCNKDLDPALLAGLGRHAKLVARLNHFAAQACLAALLDQLARSGMGDLVKIHGQQFGTTETGQGLKRCIGMNDMAATMQQNRCPDRLDQ